MKTAPIQILEHFYGKEPELFAVLLKHSQQVRAKALQIREFSGLDLDPELVSTGALLHDTGIIRCHAPGILCFGSEHYIRHGITGARMLRDYDPELEIFARICERHTGSGLTAEEIIRQQLPLPEQDFLPETLLEQLICLADKFFSKSGNMEEKPFAAVRRSMAKFGPASLERFDRMCKNLHVAENLPGISKIEELFP